MTESDRPEGPVPAGQFENTEPLMTTPEVPWYRSTTAKVVATFVALEVSVLAIKSNLDLVNAHLHNQQQQINALTDKSNASDVRIQQDEQTIAQLSGQLQNEEDKSAQQVADLNATLARAQAQEKADAEALAQEAQTLKDHDAQSQQQLGTVGNVLSQYADVNINTILRIGLKQPVNLPGSNYLISAGQRQTLESSTITLLERLKGSSNDWNETCTGTKVGSDFVLTARHCMSFGYYLNPHSPVAADVLPNSGLEYAIGDPSASFQNRTTGTPIAKVTAVSTILRNAPDLALLRVKSDQPNFQTRTFDQIPAIAMDRIAQQTPVLGEQVALYSIPGSVNNNAVRATGVYLGRVKATDLTNNTYDVVGLQVTDASQDPFEHGGSGSMFEAANGYFSGPLRFRAPNLKEKELNLPVGNNSDDPFESTFLRLRTENSTGLDLTKIKVIGAFAVPSANIFPQLVQGLDTKLYDLFFP